MQVRSITKTSLCPNVENSSIANCQELAMGKDRQRSSTRSRSPRRNREYEPSSGSKDKNKEKDKERETRERRYEDDKKKNDARRLPIKASDRTIQITESPPRTPGTSSLRVQS